MSAVPPKVVSSFNVGIIGAGPTGLILAHLLSSHGIKTVLIDKETGPATEPRAVTIDDESLRIIQGTKVLPEILGSIVQGYGVHYYSWRKKLFAKIEPSSLEYGFSKRNAFRQQFLVKTLSDALKNDLCVQLLFNHELTSFSQTENMVTMELLSSKGVSKISVDYLIGCDGGHSKVRELLGVSLVGSSYSEKWLIVDLIGRKSKFKHTTTYCDPARPAIRLPGPESTLRYEFMLLKGESPEDVLNDKQLRRWIADIDPLDQNLEILRKVIYTFHARLASKWRDHHVFLAGDAAHLTPPFAGQGMNSGVRDVSNLAWKLAAVIKGAANNKLLSTYELERRPHAWSLIKMALRIGAFMQPKSIFGAFSTQSILKLICLFPPAKDYILQLKFKPKPKFVEGFFVSENKSNETATCGQLMPQPLLETSSGSVILLDEVLGNNFSFIKWINTPTPLSIKKLNIKELEVIRHDADFTEGYDSKLYYKDIEKVIGRVLDGSNAIGALLRPDRYICGFVRKGDNDLSKELKSLIAQFIH